MGECIRQLDVLSKTKEEICTRSGLEQLLMPCFQPWSQCITPTEMEDYVSTLIGVRLSYNFDVCKGYAYKDPFGGCGSAHWAEDCWCDDENNNADCNNFDGGACCNSNIPGWDYYCSECQCLQ